ncbi:MAG: AAA family ATPase [Casimicrobiaceae bacterium]
MKPRIIGLVGAECTGKTKLAQALARVTDGLWVPEYLRTFCEERGCTPQREEQGLILETQHVHILACAAQARLEGRRFVFCDTTALMTAIYSRYVFGDASLLPRARQLHRLCHRTLFCRPDLPWQADGIQRDGPEARAAVDRLIEEELALLGISPQQITGVGTARLEVALSGLP